MELYRLKKEARQFFNEYTAKQTKPMEYWNDEKIHSNLLEKVDKVFIELGVRDSGTSATISGWDSNDGSPIGKFHFTVYVTNMGHDVYQNISIPDMMDEMQMVLNRFIKTDIKAS